jgi:hypothetical protein
MSASLRPWLLGAFLIAGLGLDLYLVVGERITDSERQIKHVALKADPLIQLRYTPESREANLAAFGFSGDDLQKAGKALKGLGTEENETKLRTLLSGVDDVDTLSKALCVGGDAPPRYNAMAWLVEEAQGRREVLNIARCTGLQRQPWSLAAPIAEVYKDAELGRERQPDATIMAFAAILEGKEASFMKKETPWGRGFGTTWSWADVEKRFPGARDRVIRYVADMHLLLETATADGGFCGD